MCLEHVVEFATLVDRLAVLVLRRRVFDQPAVRDVEHAMKRQRLEVDAVARAFTLQLVPVLRLQDPSEEASDGTVGRNPYFSISHIVMLFIWRAPIGLFTLVSRSMKISADFGVKTNRNMVSSALA